MGGRVREITTVKVLDHPTHGPDLAPSNFHFFLHLEKHMASQKFHEDEEVKNEVTILLCAQAAEFYDIRVQKLLPRLCTVLP